MTTTTKPTIAVLGGTGKEGPGLALRWAYAGYPIIIGSRQAEKAQATADEMNAKLVEMPGKSHAVTVRGMENGAAARLADLNVLTVVASAQQTALVSLKEDLQGKILVDATARVDFRDPRPPGPPSAARTAQDILGPGVRVVAAFQNVPSHALKKNPGEPIDSDVLVCSDDPRDAEQVIALAADGGMRAFYGGGLDNANVVEGLTSILISVNKYYGTKTASISISGLGK